MAFAGEDIPASTYVPDSERQVELAVLANVFRTVRESPVRSFDRQRAEDLLDAVVADAQAETSFDMTRLREPLTTNEEKRGACEATIALYDRVFRFQIQTLRWWFDTC